MTKKLATAITSVVWTLLLAALVGSSLAQASAQGAARGKELFDLCKQCHGPDGGGMQLSLAPAIAGLDQWYVEAQLQKFKAGIRGLHALDLGGLRMLPMSRWLRNEADVTAVAQYVSDLPRLSPDHTVEGGDTQKGETAYALCKACHGDGGEGNQAMNSPPLRSMSDWYLMTTLQKFKDGVRGTNPANPTEMLMRGMALSLADEQAIKDVVAHIMTLK